LDFQHKIFSGILFNTIICMSNVEGAIFWLNLSQVNFAKDDQVDFGNTSSFLAYN
jgi:hypothetical protein